MHTWMLLRFALIVLAFGIVLVIAFLTEGPDGRRGPAAKAAEARGARAGDALPPG